MNVASMNDDLLAFRAVLLAFMCADRGKRHDHATDPTWVWDDRELRAMAPIVTKRFSTKGDA